MARATKLKTAIDALEKARVTQSVASDMADMADARREELEGNIVNIETDIETYKRHVKDYELKLRKTKAALVQHNLTARSVYEAESAARSASNNASELVIKLTSVGANT